MKKKEGSLEWKLQGQQAVRKPQKAGDNQLSNGGQDLLLPVLLKASPERLHIPHLNPFRENRRRGDLNEAQAGEGSSRKT